MSSQAKRLFNAFATYAAIMGASFLVIVPIHAASFTTTVFATGGPVGASSPDSVTFGNNSLWVEYGNGASSTGGSGSSTIVQYSLAGSALHTYSIPGSVDGLKYNPNTGQVWALQNQDANSTLTIINPATQTTSTFAYGPLYNSMSGSRGLDDVVFSGSQIFMSVTNPASGTDPVIVQLTNLVSPLLQSAILTSGAIGTNRATGLQGTIPATDTDSLKSGPNGSLILTGEADHSLMFVNNPGQASQSVSFLNLVTATGSTTGAPDDALFPTAAQGTFYVADTGANVIYAITAAGLVPNTSLYGDVGNAFSSVDPTTGVVTPIFTGMTPHGMDFVASPEPGALGLCAIGLLFVVGRRRSKGRKELIC
jgi:hypothetical protein